MVGGRGLGHVTPVRRNTTLEGGREREREREREGGREGGREGEGVIGNESMKISELTECGQNNAQICTNQGKDNYHE